jgi:hypothetical protein
MNSPGTPNAGPSMRVSAAFRLTGGQPYDGPETGGRIGGNYMIGGLVAPVVAQSSLSIVEASAPEPKIEWAHLEKTLVFCTSFFSPNPRSSGSLDVRYCRWLDGIKSSKLQYDQILIVDDGSETLPDQPDITVIRDTDGGRSDAKTVLFHFTQHLGRRGVSNFPGWVRSFFFAAAYARENGFTRIFHIESDAFLISDRIQEYFNATHDGWIAFWCPRYARPESGIQIIAGNALEDFYKLSQRNYEEFAEVVVETALPFTHVEHQFRGDRYGEFLDHIPRDADWSMQTIPPHWVSADVFFWWLRDNSNSRAIRRIENPDLYLAVPGDERSLNGTYYLDFMRNLDAILRPRTYFEIGTSDGKSLECFSCNSACVDPHFAINHNVIGTKTQTSFFQQTSDEFFSNHDLALYMKSGLDIVFLDGLHLSEALLRDFINIENFCHPRSIILIHDCLPLNRRMADRTRFQDPDEDSTTRDFWTGDVWKLLPILQKYRPDLKILQIDCPPTGLIACLSPDPNSRVLAENYGRIVAEFENMDLETFTFERLWTLFPMLDSRKLIANPEDLRAFFGG